MQFIKAFNRCARAGFLPIAFLAFFPPGLLFLCSEAALAEGNTHWLQEENTLSFAGEQTSLRIQTDTSKMRHDGPNYGNTLVQLSKNGHPIFETRIADNFRVLGYTRRSSVNKRGRGQP